MENPVCVDVCPTHALEIVDLDEFDGLLHQKRLKTIQETVAAKKDGKVLLLDSAK